jgi:hypothetical protein
LRNGITLSPYLVENSRNLYYAQHYENEDQNLTFLSFREYLETLRVPEGREIGYGQFTGRSTSSSSTLCMSLSPGRSARCI